MLADFRRAIKMGRKHIFEVLENASSLPFDKNNPCKSSSVIVILN
jgi:hypothetical protein